MRKVLSGLLVLSAIAAALPATAGYRLLGTQGTQTLLSKGRFKMVPRAAEGAGSVFDLAQGRLWSAHAQKKTYWEGTPEEFCAGMQKLTGSAMADAQRQMKDQLAKLPPDQRAQMEKLMQQQGMGGALAPPEKPAQVTVERSTETATIAGVSARRFRVLADGKPFEDLWLTSDPGLTREVNLARAPEAYARFVVCQFQGMAPGPRKSVYESPEYAKIYGQGVLLKTVHYAPDGTSHTVSEIASVEARDIPDSEFAPPAGFRKVSLQEFLGAPAR